MNDIISAVESIVELAERMKGAYFFTPPTSASARRAYEKKNSVPMVEWDEGGHHYTAEYVTECSCHNVYARGEYTRDGKKTTITAIKNSVKRMNHAAQ